MKKLIVCLMCAVMLFTMAPGMAEIDTTTYTTLYASEVTTLNYLVTSSANEYALAANCIDTLVEYNHFGEILPSLATEWESSEDGLTWTFRLRNDAVWIDHNAEVYAPVTANDFVASARYILTAANASATASTLFGVLLNAEQYFNGEVTDFEQVGVKALDDYTLEYTLCEPIPYFLSMLTYVNFMPVNEQFLNEKGESFGLATGNDTLLYCGAYYLSEFKPQQIHVLSVNPTNWDKDNVHITSIVDKYNAEASVVSAELFLRGEVDNASIDTNMAADWLMDEAKAAMIHPTRITSFYSYFYSFNFDPQYDAAYEPDNWRVAVASENFRKSIICAFNRAKAKSLVDAENPEGLLLNTITPPTFVVYEGVDYVNMGDLAELTALGSEMYNKDEAETYKQAAIAELTGEVNFPVKVLLLYNPNSTTGNSAEEAQVVEQQLESVLGADYIDVVIEAGPATSYLTARRTGMYSMMNCNWGPDYADPQTFTDPFTAGNSYCFMDRINSADVDAYYKMVDEAIAIVDDLEARYLAFAKAEAYLINHGYVIPFGYGTGGYTASLLDPFTAPIAPFGLTTERYKGQYKLDHYMDTDMYYDALDAYEEEKLNH